MKVYLAINSYEIADYIKTRTEEEMPIIKMSHWPDCVLFKPLKIKKDGSLSGINIKPNPDNEDEPIFSKVTFSPGWETKKWCLVSDKKISDLVNDVLKDLGVNSSNQDQHTSKLDKTPLESAADSNQNKACHRNK